MTKFVVDSSCDIYSYEDVKMQVAPLMIYTDEVQFIDDEKLDVLEMIGTLENHKGRSYTACPGTEDWMKAFEGADTIFIATITSGLSGSYNSALVAKDMYIQEHPDAKIEVFDTLSAGPGVLLAIEKAIELSKQGLSFEQIRDQTREYIKRNRLFFALKSLHNMGQNGRVNKVLVSAVGLLGISIIGTASEEGKLKPLSKCRGDKKVIASMLKELEECGYKGGKIRICHVDNEELAIKVIDAIKDKYGDKDVTCHKAGGLCSYYAERGGIMMSCEAQ